MDDHDAKYKVLLQRIAGYPVTDPAARARVLRQVSVQYRRERVIERARDGRLNAHRNGAGTDGFAARGS